MEYIKLEQALHILDVVMSDDSIKHKGKAIRKRLKELPKTNVTYREWISVKNGLPEENARVLVLLKPNDCHTKFDTDRLVNSRWVRWGSDVTHWSLIPETLKEGVNNG